MNQVLLRLSSAFNITVHPIIISYDYITAPTEKSFAQVELSVLAPSGNDAVGEDMKNFADQLRPLVKFSLNKLELVSSQSYIVFVGCPGEV